MMSVSTALSVGLEETLGAAAKVTLHTIGAQEAAILAIGTHTQKVREAMDSEVSAWSLSSCLSCSWIHLNMLYMQMFTSLFYTQKCCQVIITLWYWFTYSVTVCICIVRIHQIKSQLSGESWRMRSIIAPTLWTRLVRLFSKPSTVK